MHTMNTCEKEIDQEFGLVIARLETLRRLVDGYMGPGHAEHVKCVRDACTRQRDDFHTTVQTRLNTEAAYRARGLRVENVVEVA